MDINNYKNSKEKEKNKTFLTQSGEDRESGEEQYVTNFHNNCIAGFKYFNFKDFKGISFKLRGRAKGKIFISNSEKGDFVGECAIDINCDEWTEVYSEFSIMNGIGALFFKYVGENFIEIISFKLF